MAGRRGLAAPAGLAARGPLPARASTNAQKCEYIWFDGKEAIGEKGTMFNEMRSKTKVLQKPVPAGSDPPKYPMWSFDASSPDPIRGGDHVLVMCEVLQPDGTPHPTNTRRPLADFLAANPNVVAEKPMYGFEQEYTMMGKDGRVYGRELAEAHLDACIKAGFGISGINAEVMPGQWEYQIGPVGPLEMGDETMVSRWLLHRLGEDMGIVSTFEPKPMKGDWNGTGAHTNFSTESMRKA